MSVSDESYVSQLEYFQALRSEIVETQKLRVQVCLAKVVFLGTLIGFFFKDGRGDPAILICPFVALMFDCMVYGLSFNIHDLGSYIGEYLESPAISEGSWEPWQRYRKTRLGAGFRDWGRIVFRVGSYGLSSAVSILAFAETMPPAGTRPTSTWAWIWRIIVIASLLAAWFALIYREFSRRKANEDEELSSRIKEAIRHHGGPKTAHKTGRKLGAQAADTERS